MKPDYSAIPAELLNLKQWVAWRDEPGRGKVPVKPWARRPLPPPDATAEAKKQAKYRARSNDPSTWATFADAVHGAERLGLGIGFMFKKDGGYTGVDMDDCIDDAGNIEPWAAYWVELLNSYTEISPSGRGVKAWARGKKPGTECGAKVAGVPVHTPDHPPSVEMYDQTRFFTVTANALNGHRTIEDRQPVIDGFYRHFLSGNNGAQEQTKKILGLPVPPDFEQVLSSKLNFKKRTRGDTTYFDYHGLAGNGKDGAPQPCLIQGSIHPAYATHVEECSFAVRGGFFWHCCFDSDCRCQLGEAQRGLENLEPGDTLGKTRTALLRLDELVPGKSVHDALCGKPSPKTAYGTPPAAAKEKIPHAPATIKVSLKSYDQIPKEHLAYQWDRYIAVGKLIHLAGNSGEGKSPISLEIAARVSTGAAWPDGTPNPLGPRSVILLAAEDDPGDTVRPRLELAGADLKKIHHAVCTVHRDSGDQEKMLALSTDLAALLETARTVPDLALIVIDPITNYLGANAKMNADDEMRQLLMPLALAAKEMSFTALTVGHLNRRERGTESLHRIMGAAAFHAIARFIYLVGADPEDTDQHAHVLVQRRGTGAPSLRYQTYAKPMEWDGKTSDVIGITWRGESHATAEDVVDPTGNREKNETAEAAKALAEILKGGRLNTADAIRALAGAGHDVERINTMRLLRKAGAKSKRFPGEKFYSWYLPTSAEKPG